ncbi:permease-like cell division protein FtsX [Zobellia galactanivorans]|uniref:Cell division protein FtsX n=1 Tax=Zobellia galactanivorans (strain DSM 12802 / CCUG 47099 / CIP 106680 / NCIMB 13871 / Dsij) TaxID=63186 RepID=G0LAK0_ZOBGA|nr:MULTISPECIES: permease-like cell division protein FtsX [Zobellia]MBU3028145.1 permease-like cell division protein FtsX [Zobellia galactanivorans]MDO6808426.1 permease-like cell division protein FtsX [Zobellia galactanivorans]OWW26438.1 ABC transporter permease [Zobellia sp. OII3]CAZ95376.1 Cell division protein FtsX [Zobellia galactanivorans]
MGKSFEQYQKQKLISSYFSVVLSIALVLFLLGILGLLVINTKKMADHFKEQITISIFLKDEAKESEIDQLQKNLLQAEHTKSAVFVSKEEAAEQHSEEIGEDFQNFLGYNPLKNSIDLQLRADYVTPQEIDSLATTLAQKTYIEEVSYDKPLVGLLSENVKRISFWILIASGVLTFIAILLINSSIRLSIYSKRFIIKTMQMVGATKTFIRRPFIWMNIKLGMFGALTALLALTGILYYLDQNFPELELFKDMEQLGMLYAAIFVLGIFISLISTFFATQRFLNLRTDELYY